MKIIENPEKCKKIILLNKKELHLVILPDKEIEPLTSFCIIFIDYL
jgi:hypothetical protein